MRVFCVDQKVLEVLIDGFLVGLWSSEGMSDVLLIAAGRRLLAARLNLKPFNCVETNQISLFHCRCHVGKGRSVLLHPMTGLDLDRVQVHRRIIIGTGNVGVTIPHHQSPRRQRQPQRLRRLRRRQPP